MSVVSNSDYRSLEKTIKIYGLEKYFAYWMAPRLNQIESYPALMKPNPYLLKKSVEKMKSERPVMVGDSESDIKAAENTGIDSVLLGRNGEKSGDADHNIETLEELPEILMN